MALYAYQALTNTGSKKKGVMDAASPQEVRERLVRIGLFPISIVRTKHEERGSLFAFLQSFFAPRVTTNDLIFFTQQFSVLLRAGVPLLQALELLTEQTEKKLQRIVIDLKDGIKEGKSLAESLEQFPHVFDSTYVQLVRAGEASGRLELILDRLVGYLERTEALKKKIRNAMAYPLIQLSVLLLVVSVLLINVVPKVAEIFKSQKATLPFSTQFLMGLSTLLRSYYLVLLGVIVLSSWLFIWWKSTERGKRTWDRLMLRLPFVGYFVRMKAVVQFCSTLGMLIEGGVNFAEAFSIVCSIIDNRVLVDALQKARENIIKQGKITLYLKDTGLFPPLALYLIRTGEESGQLAQMLLTVAQTFDREVQDRADVMAAQLNPIMTIIMGLLVGFVVMAIGKPIMQMTDVIAKDLK